MRSSVSWEELGVEPLLLHNDRSQLRWFRSSISQTPPGHLKGRSPRGRPGTRCRDQVPQLARDPPGITTSFADCIHCALSSKQNNVPPKSVLLKHGLAPQGDGLSFSRASRPCASSCRLRPFDGGQAEAELHDMSMWLPSFFMCLDEPKIL